MNQQQQWLQHAVALATENVVQGMGGPFAALIVRDGQVIAQAVNQVTANCDPTAHAEMQAIRQACKLLGRIQLYDCELYSSCEPCPMCLGAMYWAHLSAVYFSSQRQDAAAAGFDDSVIYNEIPKPLAQRQLKMQRILLPDALAPFQAWQASSAKVEY